MRVLPVGSLPVKRWVFALFLVAIAVSGAANAVLVMTSLVQRQQIQGCREVLGLLERPAVIREAVPAPHYIKGTRIYQDFEN